jgi:hypothetical protein
MLSRITDVNAKEKIISIAEKLRFENYIFHGIVFLYLRC